MISKNQDQKSIIQYVIGLLKQKQNNKAIAFCYEHIQKDPKLLEVRLILSQAHQQNGEFDLMLIAVKEADKLKKNHFPTQIRLIECLIYCGQMAEAIKTLNLVAKQSFSDASKLSRIAELYLHCGQHKEVAKYHQKALNFSPENPVWMYNLAAAKISLGKIDESEMLLNQVISIVPNDFEAYTTRSGLRVVCKQNNNIQQLEHVYQTNLSNPKSKIAIGYALAKEYEDIKDYQLSWKYLKKAADTRRLKMQYDVANDIHAIDDIIKNINHTNLTNNKSGNSQASPVFIIGLPRSGTTLVDRILSSHSDVASLGEINSLAFALIHSVGQHQGKQQLISKSTSIDFTSMANRYTSATRGYGFNEKYLIDKTPLNFLYLGLIKRAFPKAKIIHVKRNPVDSCYAMYKTLFRMGYPFSYDLDDLTSYYSAYHKLMQHWQSEFPDCCFNLDYEDLVNNSETTVKSLLEYCQLEWNPSVLDIHLNTSPSATASATQVRQNIYTSSVAKWKNYSSQLQSVKTTLENAGICCE